MGKASLSAGVFGVLVAWSSSTMAADAPATGVPATEPPRQVEVIIVTAEKREENLQEAPVAAMVLTDAMLLRDSVDNIDDLEFNTPSLTIATAGQSNQMNMRGIGKFDSGGTSTSAVATYRDGVGTVSGFFNQEPYFDISTVEVLRGPQGTYVGENAAGGAIFVNTRDPEIGAGYNGYVQGGYGDYNKKELQGAVNIPLGDNAAMRLAGSTLERHTFFDTFMDSAATIRNPAQPGDIDYDSVRASFVYRPMEQLELLLKFDYNKLNHGGHVYGNVPGFPTPVGNLTGRPYGNISGDLYTVGNNFVGALAKDRMSRGIFKLNYDFSNGDELHWVSGIQDIKTHIRNDDDGSVDADLRQHILPKFHVYTSEVTYLSSTDRSIRWLAGAFYRLENLKFPNDDGFMIYTGAPNPAPVLGLSIQWDTPRTTEAVYGQLAFDLMPTLELQLGARAQYYESKQDSRLFLGGLPFTSRDDSYDEWTGNYKVAFNWRPTADDYFYAFVATGNTTGGSSVVLPASSFSNQTSTDFEAGWKGTLLDSQILTQFGGFYTLIDNYQASFSAVTSQGPPVQQTTTFQNLDGDTKVWGVELQSQTQFGNLGLNFTAAWIHSELGEDLLYDLTLARFIETGGNRIPWTPEYTFNVGAQYDFNLPDNWVLTPRLTYSWIDEQTVTATDRVIAGIPVDRIFEHDIVNATVTLVRGPWNAQLYVTNWNEEEYIQAHSGAPGHPDAYANEPRMYGLRVTYDFAKQ